ncbi:Flp pilus assembly complex ATPase component TadA [Planctomycetota bacterium]|nr:Flp pilus assembly complex ATPase component TadA [Planctomycetota bacterium]
MIQACKTVQQSTLRVGDLLLERGLITQEQIESALEHQNNDDKRRLLGEVLVELGYVTQEQVMASLADAYGVPFASLNSQIVDPNVFELLDDEYIRKQHVLPLFKIHGKLTVAMSEPANVFVTEEIERKTNCEVQVVAATTQDISRTYTSKSSAKDILVIDELVDDIEEADLRLTEQSVEEISDIEHTANESPVIRLVNGIIFGAVKEVASDIHIEPDEDQLRVRYRIDGRLFEKANPPIGMLPAIVSRIKIMAAMDISERRIPQDGSISVIVNKRQIDLRVSTMPGKQGEKVVMRIIDRSNAQQNLSQLGFSQEMLFRYERIINQPNGIILVTGPTGSGKSTTLYASLNEINSDEINISTVEDPVEYSIKGMNQFQVNDKAGFTFANALRSLLRQDPDIIMVGEIRDKETARVSTQAALTGHLVMSTLHTNDAASAVTRLIDIGIEPYLVAATIRGVLAQRLIRKVCTHCKTKIDYTTESLNAIELLTASKHQMIDAYHGVGCSACRYSGYAGRLGVYGLLTPDEEILDLIAKNAGLQTLKHTAIENNSFITLRDDGVEKIQAGLTTIEEIVRATSA